MHSFQHNKNVLQRRPDAKRSVQNEEEASRMKEVAVAWSEEVLKRPEEIKYAELPA